MILYPWQATDVETAADAIRTTGGALFSWGMGSGKTVSAVEVAKALGAERVLVIAPLSTHESWNRTSQGQGAPEIRRASNKTKVDKEALFGVEFGLPGWYVMSHAMVTRATTEEWPAFDLVICDEIHLVAEKSSKGLKKILGIEAAGRLALSGTPARNKVENLWGVSRFLWPNLSDAGEVADSKFWRWAALRLEEKTVYTNQRDQWGNPKTVKQFTGEKDTGSIFRDMPYASVHLARERCCDAPEHKNGVLGGLSEPIVIEEVIPLTPEQKRVIRDMETQMVTWLAGHPLVADIPLTAQQRIRQAVLGVPTVTWTEDDEPVQEVSFDMDCKSPFLDRALEVIRDLDGEPVIVWTDSAKFAEVATGRLQKAGLKVDQYRGSRKADISRFGTDYQVLVAVPSSFGTGSDGAQRVCSNEIWLSRDLDSTTNLQGEARLMRNGQTSTIRRWLFWDDAGIAKGQYSSAVTRQLELNRSLKVVH